MSQQLTDASAAAVQQRAAQAGLTKLLARDMQSLRKLIVPARMQQTVPQWILAVRALVGQYSKASGSLAANYYDAERVAAGMTGRFTVPLPDPPPDGQVEASLRWATKDIWPRNPDDPKTTAVQKLPLGQRLDAAEVRAEAVTQKLVIDSGRGTIQNAVRRDKQAVGWARTAALGACAFCKLLSTRGMVYKADTVGFRAHDNCHCGAIPVFKGQRFDLSPHAAEWERLYREYAAPHSGDQLNRFRQALDAHGHTPVL